MLRRLTAAACVLVVSFTGCNRGGDEDTAASPRTSTPAPTPCSVPDGSLQPQRSDTNPESAPVTAVRYTRRTEEGCPRIVFEFTDHVPGYAVAYADGPFSECGSGDAVPTDGWDATAFLTVRLEPSGSVDTTDPNASQTYTGPRDIDVGGRVLKHMKVICDFEAVFEWVVGLDAKHDFAVFTLDDPSRIVIDVSET